MLFRACACEVFVCVCERARACVRVCVRSCVRACVSARVCARVCTCVNIYELSEYLSLAATYVNEIHRNHHS